MTPTSSVSQWIAALKEGDADAAQRLWDRFALRLAELARQRLRGVPKGIADEEDIALSVFESVCRGVSEARFNDIRNRDDLWWLLLAVTKHKVVDHVRRESTQKRGAGKVVSEIDLGAQLRDEAFSLDWLLGDDPGPDFMVALEDEHDRLLGLLRDDRLREIATLRIDGFSVPEIATYFAISTRSVERKLQLIRNAWAKELSLAE
jgi:DNA-directed RNA polymerase specialized sigma24 family protein